MSFTCTCVNGEADWSNVIQYDGLFVLASNLGFTFQIVLGFFFKAVRQNPEQKTCVQGYIHVSCMDIWLVPQHS